MARKKSAKSSKPSRTVIAVSIGAAIVTIGGAIGAIFARQRSVSGSAEHPAPDLALDQPHPGPGDRAPIDFRPDPTAPVPPAERDALRPAPYPESANSTAGANG